MNVLEDVRTFSSDSVVDSYNGVKTVLIVDESEETRDVLSTALERRGVRTFSTAIPRRGVAIAREQKPDLVIFDVDSADSPEKALNAFIQDGEVLDRQIVAIGSSKFTTSDCDSDFISKPYHFAPLLQKIEQFLQGAGVVSVSDED